jgi:hypothetical protein
LTTGCSFSYSFGACASSLSRSLLRALFFFHSLFPFIAKLIAVYSTMQLPIDYHLLLLLLFRSLRFLSFSFASARSHFLLLALPLHCQAPLCLSLPLFLVRFCALSFSFTRSSTSSPSSTSCTMQLPIDYRLLLLLLFRSLRFLSFSFASARSLFLSLALPLHRQAQRCLQCIRPLTTHCSFSYSFGACATVASNMSVACSFVSVACVAVSSSLSVARPCCFLFVLGGRLISISSSFDSTCSYNSSPSSSSSTMHSPFD